MAGLVAHEKAELQQIHNPGTCVAFDNLEPRGLGDFCFILLVEVVWPLEASSLVLAF